MLLNCYTVSVSTSRMLLFYIPINVIPTGRQVNIARAAVIITTNKEVHRVSKETE